MISLLLLYYVFFSRQFESSLYLDGPHIYFFYTLQYIAQLNFKRNLEYHFRARMFLSLHEETGPG